MTEEKIRTRPGTDLGSLRAQKDEFQIIEKIRTRSGTDLVGSEPKKGGFSQQQKFQTRADTDLVGLEPQKKKEFRTLGTNSDSFRCRSSRFQTQKRSFGPKDKIRTG